MKSHEAEALALHHAVVIEGKDMDDLTDRELPMYFRIHCETEVGAFHKKHVVRILRMAELNDDANAIEQGDKEWYYLGPAQVYPVLDKISAIEKRERDKIHDYQI